ncbi:MAG TPA: HlyD family efflux transporter periplasmic adaptor subunit, partial [Novosphingobium sp.]|nr:HlyD family efflux transporter periplasmic adaptor subunit [Novosphingobium sp.]
MTDLFRQEVFDHRADRLYGEVIINQPVAQRYYVAALGLICALAVAWVCLGTYARTETAPGILVPDRPAPKILPLAPGNVRELKVQEGSEVRAGDILAVIEIDRQTESGDGVAAASLSTIDARAALGEEQVRLSSSRLRGEQARLSAVAATADSQIADLSGQIELQREIVKSNKTLFEQAGTLVEKGFVSKIEYERRRQAWLGSLQQLSGLEQQRTNQLGQAAQARAQLGSAQAQSLSEQSEIRAGLQSLEQQRAGIESQKSYVVRAPVTGRVTTVLTNIGSTANPGSPLMTIVPEGARMKAEIYAPSRAIGFVHAGQETKLLYDAFPYQRFGSFKGRVESISRVLIDPRETPIPLKLEEPVYKVTVLLERQDVQAFRQVYPLQP